MRMVAILETQLDEYGRTMKIVPNFPVPIVACNLHAL